MAAARLLLDFTRSGYGRILPGWRRAVTKISKPLV